MTDDEAFNREFGNAVTIKVNGSEVWLTFIAESPERARQVEATVYAKMQEAGINVTRAT